MFCVLSNHALDQPFICTALWKHKKHWEHLCSCIIIWLLCDRHLNCSLVWFLAIWLQGVLWGHYSVMLVEYSCCGPTTHLYCPSKSLVVLEHLCSCMDMWFLRDSHSSCSFVWFLAIWLQGVLWGHYDVMRVEYSCCGSTTHLYCPSNSYVVLGTHLQLYNLLVTVWQPFYLPIRFHFWLTVEHRGYCGAIAVLRNSLHLDSCTDMWLLCESHLFCQSVWFLAIWLQ